MVYAARGAYFWAVARAKVGYYRSIRPIALRHARTSKTGSQVDATLIAALSALAAAFAWGSGDFTAGLAARRLGPFRTVLLTYIVGLLSLMVAATRRGEPMSPAIDLMWGALAGFAGTVGLSALLRGFTVGRMGIVAPLSATLSTVIPVVVTAVTIGLPAPLQLLGFGLAMLSVWLLSRREPTGDRPAGLGMGLLAGLGFAGFFLGLDQVSVGPVFWPLAAGRLSSIVVLAAAALAARRPILRGPLPLRLLVPAGVLDVAGNLFFLIAVQSGRLDVAAALVALYPAITAVLARLFSDERLSRLQTIGVGVAVAAIVLITA